MALEICLQKRFFPFLFRRSSWLLFLTAKEVLFFCILNDLEKIHLQAGNIGRKKPKILGVENSYWDMDFIRAPLREHASSRSEDIVLLSAPGSKFPPWANLVRETAGQGLSRDNGGFWCADKQTGQIPQWVCDDVSWSSGILGVLMYCLGIKRPQFVLNVWSKCGGVCDLVGLQSHSRFNLMKYI